MGYFLSAKGTLCTDDGNIPVDDIETCQVAIEELNESFEGLENYASWKKGCYLYGSYAYFHRNLTGHRKGSTRQICKSTGNG